MINISSPPKTELNMNLKIAFTGIENIFPTIHKAIIHPIITKILEKSKLYHRILFSNTYDRIWTNITYPT